MPIIFTDEMDPGRLPAHQKLWVYNALDCTVTFEVRDALRREPTFDAVAQRTYRFSKSLQAPVLSMMLTGFKIDMEERQRVLDELNRRVNKLQARLNSMAMVLWGKPLNPQSPKQVESFFYDHLKLPAEWKRNKQTGEKRRTVDRDALEKLENYFKAAIFVRHIMRIRELTKLAGAIRSEVDRDGRMRTTFNIAGTETGRFSSNASADDTGTNLQNQTERVRRMYVADPGYKLAVFDLKTGESFAVGLKCKLLGFGDAYLRACQGNDLHTTVTKLVWPGLAWVGDKGDKAVAEQLFYRHFSYRDMAKRGGHGTNYYGTPWTMAKHLKIDPKIMEEFQPKYFAAFPEIREWHTWTAGQLQTTQTLTSLMGRRRHFFGRSWDDATLREAIAYDPQSSIADYTNTWLLRVHRNVRSCKVLLQGHDALVVSFPEKLESEVVEGVLYEASQVRLGTGPDSITIPAEAKTGWNWGKVDPKKKMHPDGNPFGLADYKGKDDRVYEPKSATAYLLDRRIS